MPLTSRSGAVEAGEKGREISSWAPGRNFELCVDAAYASMARELPENVVLVSRLRKDAALYNFPPARTGRRGRPRKKGSRLPSPAEHAKMPGVPWCRCELSLYGKRTERLVVNYHALWYSVLGEHPISVIMVRDPEGKAPDAFFFTTTLRQAVVKTLQHYSSRWSVEVAVWESKQALGIEGPQARLPLAGERQAPFAWFLLSVVKLWFLQAEPAIQQEMLPSSEPWYAHKDGVSFRDMLASLRREIWIERIFLSSPFEPHHHKILEPLLRQAAWAA